MDGWGAVALGRFLDLPRSDLMIKWRRATARLQEKLGRIPTEEEIATSLNLPPKKLKIIRKAIHIYNAILKTCEGNGGPTIDEFCVDETSMAPVA